MKLDLSRSLILCIGLSLLSLLALACGASETLPGESGGGKADDGLRGDDGLQGENLSLRSMPPAFIVDREKVSKGRRFTTRVTLQGGAELSSEPEGAATGDKKGKAAQKKLETWKRSRAPQHRCRVRVGIKDELKLEGIQARVRVDGFRARVLIDFYFRNHKQANLLGQFQLRLPNGASPYFFAFGECVVEDKGPVLIGDVLYSAEEARRMRVDPADIMRDRADRWSKPKEARMVPRERAAHAYLNTVRRGVDPALMEWAGAGIFNANVFPLAPGKLHRIVIGYDVDLVRAGTDWLLDFELPSGDFRRTIDLTVKKIPGCEVSLRSNGTDVALDGAQPQHFEGVSARKVVLRQSLASALALRGKDGQQNEFFAARFTARLPAVPQAKSSEMAVFLLDTSLSSSPDRFPVFLKLLDALLAENEDQIRRFAVLFFDVETRWWRKRFTKNSAKNRAALRKAAGELALEGATDLARALETASMPRWIDSGLPPSYPIFLLSDAATNFGEQNEWRVAARLRGFASRLFAYRTAHAGADPQMLNRLANRSGGAVFSVLGEAELAKAARAHRNSPWAIRSMQLEGCSDLLLAGRPGAIYPGQQLSLVGRGKASKGAQLILSLERGPEARRLIVPIDTVLDSDLAVRAYGQVATTELESFEQLTEKVSRSYAMHFRVTGKTCSLLMLESKKEYERYGIRPTEDAFVVKKRPAVRCIDEALQRVDAELGSPKRAFLAFLDRLQEVPGVKLRIPESLRIALREMTDSAFQVAVAPLRCKLRRASEVPGALQEQLASRELDYATFVAEAMRREKAFSVDDALKALSSLIEQSPKDTVLLKDIAYAAIARGRADVAYPLLRSVAERRPFEGPIWLDLARCLVTLDKPELALAHFEVAMRGNWPARFGEFRRIAGIEYLRFLKKLEKSGRDFSAMDYAVARARTLRQEIGLEEADLMVSIAWNTDNSDVDLHVKEPTGEVCFYSHPKTKIGGTLSKDVTQGFGPELYVLPKAVHGEYQILVKYFASVANRTSARSKVMVTILRDWGRRGEQITRKTVTLETGKQIHEVAKIRIEK